MGDDPEIRQWTAQDGTIFIDKGNGERVIVKPDRDDPSTVGAVFETGDKEFSGSDDE